MIYSPFLQKIFSKSFRIFIGLVMLISVLLFMRFPASLYQYIITTLSDFLKAKIETNGSVIKIENGLHKLSKLLLFLSIGLIAYLQFWQWLLKRLKENNNHLLANTYFNTKLEKLDWFNITCLTIGAILLRVFPLTQSLWQDEIGVYKAFIEPGILSTVYPKTSIGSQPLMQILVILFTKVFGVSEVTLRFPVFIFAVSTIPLLYFVCIKISGRRMVAIIASLFLTFHSYHIYYSFQMRGYAIVVFLCTLSIYLLIKVLYSSSKQTNILFILTNTLLVYTHLWAVYFVIAQQIMLVSVLMYQLWKHDLQNIFSVHHVAALLQSFIITLILIVIIYLPQCPVLLINVLSDNNASMSLSSYFYLVISTSHNMIAYTNYAIITRLYGLTIAFIYLFIVNKNTSYQIIFYTSIIFFFMTAFALNASGFFPRYLMCDMPLFLIINAAVIYELWNSSRAIYKSLSIILVIAFFTLSFISYPNTYRNIQNYKGAVEFVKNKNQNQKHIVVANSLGKSEIQYYDKKIIPLYSTQQLDSLITENNNVYAITTYERFAGRSIFLKDKETQIKIEKQFTLIKTFDGENPVHVWYCHR